jgi:GT2 family glycosyltransferase
VAEKAVGATAKTTTKSTAKAATKKVAKAATKKVANATAKAAAKQVAKATTKKAATAVKAVSKTRAASKRKTFTTPKAGPPVRISVVVPTCNRAARMMRLIDALAAQNIGEPFEVVVVDDVSKDDTLSRLRAAAHQLPFSLVIVESAVNTGPAGARNRGWRKANGELIAFVDDDCVPDPGWLKAIADGLDGADIAIGRTRPPNDQLHLIGPFSSYLDIGHNRTYSTCNIGYRRSLLDEMDGFDEVNFRYPNGEDTDLGLRAVKAGYRDAFAPDAVIWHDVGHSSFKAHFDRIERLDGLVALASLHPEAREIMECGYFLRSVDKAVFISWAAILGLLLRPRLASTRLFATLAAVLYVWQYRKWHYKARSAAELVTSIPQGFVADSWATMVMIRSSVRYRTVLL